MTKRGKGVLFVSMLLTLTIALGGCAGDMRLHRHRRLLRLQAQKMPAHRASNRKRILWQTRT